MIIGLVAGVAAGKSFVAKKLAQFLDGIVIDADRLAREVVDDPAVLKRLLSEFGEGILSQDGSLDRAALARLVFGDHAFAEQRRIKLNSIVHPLVRKKALAKIEATRADRPDCVIIIDAPLLLEAGWQPVCDHILFIDTSEEFRGKNASARGWSRDELMQREQSQLSLAEKRARSTAVIQNPGTEDELATNLRTWIASINGSPKPE